MRIVLSKRLGKQLSKLPYKTQEEVINVLGKIKEANTIEKIVNIKK